MNTWEWLAVGNAQALKFFFERLKRISEPDKVGANELLYNASVLAHFASTSTGSGRFPVCPTSLTAVFDVFVLDQSQHADSEIMEAAASQCLLLTGFFHDQLTRRYNVKWYAALGAGFYDNAAQHSKSRERIRMMAAMSARFDFWRRQQQRLARELRDQARLIQPPQ